MVSFRVIHLFFYKVASHKENRKESGYHPDIMQQPFAESQVPSCVPHQQKRRLLRLHKRYPDAGANQ
ncbi:MAG: hypothetical protein D6732_06545 [Methanobacteriota archaeon]|nr:MAG: hypothetical protein D6732_06545 [Euryarchaeota archaeon]